MFVNENDFDETQEKENLNEQSKFQERFPREN